MLWALQETFFESVPVREGPPSALFENSRNLASSSRGLGPDITGKATVPERETRREPENSSIPVYHVSREELEFHIILVELILTMV